MINLSESPSRWWSFLYPALGLAAFFFGVGAWFGDAEAEGLAILPLMFAVLGSPFFYFRQRNLADEVVDEGHSILVKMKGEQERIPLSNIASADRAGNWMYLLVTPGKFGSEIRFVAKSEFLPLMPYTVPKIVKNLNARAEKARSMA